MQSVKTRFIIPSCAYTYRTPRKKTRRPVIRPRRSKVRTVSTHHIITDGSFYQPSQPRSRPFHKAVSPHHIIGNGCYLQPSEGCRHQSRFHKPALLKLLLETLARSRLTKTDYARCTRAVSNVRQCTSDKKSLVPPTHPIRLSGA